MKSRIRRAPAAARAEILSAAHALLDERGYESLSVDRVMRRTGMTRSAFYHYFRNLEELSLGLFEPLESEMIAAVEPWLSSEATTAPAETMAQSLRDVVGVVERHRAVIASVEATAGRHAEIWESWRVRILDLFIRKTAEYVRSLRRSGVSDVEDSGAIARTLILMNHAMLIDWARGAHPVTAERLAETLTVVWTRTLLSKPAAWYRS